MSFGSVGRIRSISSRSRCATSISFDADQRPDPEVDALLARCTSRPCRPLRPQARPWPRRSAARWRRRGRRRSGSSNSSAERRSVLASRLTWTRLPFVRPTAARIVVAPERRLHVAGREVERGETIGIDPDAHGDLAAALDGHPLDTRQRRELRLQRAQQPVGDGRHAALAWR